MSTTYEGGPITVTATGAAVSFGAASTQGTLPNASSGEISRYIRVAATQACYFRLGIGTATAVSTDLLIQPADSVVLSVPRGVDKFAAIQVTTGGVVVVSPMENS